MPLNFPTSRTHWRLDVVSLLAVIGESSMAKHAQPLTASWLCLLPRLIPAPQALIHPARPAGLPSQPAHVVGIHSGNYLQELNYFANLIHPISDLKRHSIHEIYIKHKPIKDRSGFGNEDKVKEIVTKYFSFLNFLTVGSTLLSLALLVWSVIHQDGPACIAIAIISITSTLVGGASYWRPLLTERTYDSDVPPGDIVIRTRSGAFVVVHCTEEVARELYVGAEDCDYVLDTRPAQVLVGTGTILLMIGVVLVGNCTFEMQVALGASYIALNGLYWVAALLPPRNNWDLFTRYEWDEARVITKESYTCTLYEAIIAASRISKDKVGEIKTSWAKTSRAAPDTPVWNKWLDEVAEKGNTDVDGKPWDPVESWKSIKRNDDAERGIVKSEKDIGPITKGVLRRPTDEVNGRKVNAGN
ncbi:hypothetical protein EPUS_08528 [Endocarpon pusillum Z07020]|uniref:Uncharacterized protein n=1 Tax=Endocarpon pusillum (strain Z07020 / HMAS-L-300199) TaxID=1263415 RepID=U1GBQ3_ENDPU|nr:uncharacterized protein EPUS_08528 [Endocarpon pusillum Z07020]ERF74987.1 hypothetical protein EPUS_08528 [Endocarpon pusillum Z07020]